MINLLYTDKDLTKNFSAAVLKRGKDCQAKQTVSQLASNYDGTELRATVTCSAKQIYKTQITVETDDDGTWIDGTCSCPAKANCEHITATLWEALEQAKTAHPEVLSHLQNTSAIPNIGHLIYLMSLHHTTHSIVLIIELCLVHKLKHGNYSKPLFCMIEELNTHVKLTSKDQKICYWLDFIKQQHEEDLPKLHYPLTGTNGAQLLNQIIETGRCHWASVDTPALKTGPARNGTLEWLSEGKGLQRLTCRVAGHASIVVPLIPLWYIDPSQHLCGSVITNVNDEIAAALLAAPPLKPEQIRQLQASITQKLNQQQPAISKPAVTQVRQMAVQPIPILHLYLAKVSMQAKQGSGWSTYEQKLPLAKLAFRYGAARVNYDDPKTHIDYVNGQELIQTERNRAVEEQALKQLLEMGMIQVKESQQFSITTEQHQHDLLIWSTNDTQQYLEFSLKQIPKLRAAGWQIEIEDNYPYRVVEKAEDWYSNIEETPGNNWFTLELGILINGERVNLLPILLDLIRKNFDRFANPQTSDSEQQMLLARLPDGRYLPIPHDRLRNIFNILTELHDNDSLTGSEKLQLSRLRAAQLSELEAALGASKIRWFGGEKLRQLGNKLHNFNGIKPIPAPSGFQTTLRPYQEEGLGWLQFLREYGLAGILADDMGLGKTVQTLAHLSLEKISGRMDKPCLIIAPTSLMVNWRLEAQRFAPNLRILTLHGIDRRRYYSLIQYYDLIFTTYPLLVRDKKTLLATDYHYIILDEAHIIKNPNAKATQIVQQLKGRHRLCLTGTPMENNLGELWSLFNFLLPGLLGEHEQFKRLFRIPIEKNNDFERQKSLAQRIAPFLLRRTKQAVVHELPAKTEIIRQVELEGVQRDLYEGIRMAMHQKITLAIQNKGLANSKIIILDALLKLRQTCCDPRLIKLDAAKQAGASSAKLLLLMDMLPNLIAEGRRILLFSQFTEMLKLIEAELQKHKIQYVTLTGQTKDRATPIQMFQNQEVPLFLISLKAGGTGLNLTAADTVIHYDPWWNPAVELQATDRAHRIGQDKAVFVYKLISRSTIEEKIIDLQQRKQALLDNLFNNQQNAQLQFQLEDIEQLFKPLEEI